MLGRIMLTYLINFSEILRIFEKEGWSVENTIFTKKEEELNSEIPFAVIKKGNFYAEIPFAHIARITYEMLNPKVLIATFEEQFKKGPQDTIYSMTNYSKEPSLWE